MIALYCGEFLPSLSIIGNLLFPLISPDDKPSEDNNTIFPATTNLTGEAPTPIPDIDDRYKLSITFSASANPASVQFAQIITQWESKFWSLTLHSEQDVSHQQPRRCLPPPHIPAPPSEVTITTFNTENISVLNKNVSGLTWWRETSQSDPPPSLTYRVLTASRTLSSIIESRLFIYQLRFLLPLRFPQN